MFTLFTRVVCAFAVGAALVLVPTSASAHFDLVTPASWSVDDQASGMPEKLGPCGNEGTPVPAKDDAGRPIITAVQEGDMITVTISEVVFHPGHYRISLSTDWADAGDTVQSGFPPDPLVTPGATNSGTMVCPGGAGLKNPCGSVPLEQGTLPVEIPGVGWVLADDVFEHCDPFTTAQTIKVALPPGVTCKECVLQVLEFMSDHGLNVPGGCFYHHCANLSISGQSVPVEAGTGSGASSGAASGTSGEASGATGSPGSGGTMAATGTVDMSGSAAPSGTVAATGGESTGTSTPTSGSVGSSGSSSGTPAGSSGTSTSPGTTSAAKSSGCTISPRGGSFGAGLAGLALGVALTRRRRRSRFSQR
jgi:hypothetical protein